MLNNFKGKSLLSLNDFSKEEIAYLVDFSIQLKEEKKSNIQKDRLKNKSIALIFEKTSTRTRCAASVACFDEGGHSEFLGKDDIQMGKKESIRDTARVLGGMFSAILFRGFEQETVDLLAKYSGIPVINGLTDREHPTQILADFMTIKEVFGRLEKLKITYLGDGRNNVANTLLLACAKMGIDIAISCPKSLFPENKLIEDAKILAKQNNSSIIITEDPFLAVRDADVIYTDVWVSMGEEDKPEIQERIKSLMPYSVTKKIMDSTGKPDTIFLHCLPATHKDEVHYMEVTEEVFESKQSYVFLQAENRLHTIKSVLISLIGGVK
ncbi:MAG: ornithine carbamoyltransferase [Spirochaetes bacterium GWB1_27_13]|nr:MAG: ornithine carbamoyltransferase [Spirochaetes bacterium GWB1_27_13]